MAQAEQQLAQARQGVFESATRARDALEIWLATDKEALKLAEKEKATRRNAWDRVIPFFAFPPAVRKVIYTTNAIENINAQLRKIIKTRGHFPSDGAATKLIWLALRNITANWSRPSHDWKTAMNQFAILYAERFVQATM